jgi:hypothetical protein
MHRTDVKDSSRMKNPVKYHVTYAADEGVFEYWDGEQTVQLNTLEFAVLTTKGSIGGWYPDAANDGKNKGRIYSNLISPEKMKEEPFVVKVGKTELCQGIYQDIKDKVNSKRIGGVYVNNIFCMANIDGEFVPVNFQIKGSSLAEWSRFVKDENMYTVFRSLVKAEKGDPKMAGENEFFLPSFSLSALPDEVKTAANEFDETQLKPFFASKEAPVKETV